MTLADRLLTGLATGGGARPLMIGDHAGLAALPADRLTPAAVLVPFTDRADPGLILTERADSLRRHAGQVAFPGGRVDPDDAGPIDAALREAKEEIDLDRRHVTVIGVADPYRTLTGYDVAPVIGVVPPDLALTPSAAEVATVFEVPVSFLFDPANHHRASAMWEGQRRYYYEMRWRDRRIWGATAAIIVNLSRRLRLHG